MFNDDKSYEISIRAWVCIQNSVKGDNDGFSEVTA